MEFKGRIAKVMPVQTGTNRSGDEWRKLEFVFEYFEHDTDRWSDKVVLSVMNSRIDEYDIHEGDEVLIGFGHGVSNEWKGRIFNELRLYKFEKINSQQAAQQAPQSTQAGKVEQQPTTAPVNAQSSEKEEELPF